MDDVNNIPSPETPVLPPGEYALLVSPVLQVAAKVAAVRGDPDLYNDIASMLALKAIVEALGECYLHQHPDAPASMARAIEIAPMGACVMVLEHADLSSAQIGDCTWALQAATRQISDAGVLGGEQALVWEAWQLLSAGDHDKGIGKLMLAVTHIVDAVDAWERARAEPHGLSGSPPPV